ncbi:MAG: hypothetical protein U1F36_14075 [Planctomycetota bacterium]
MNGSRSLTWILGALVLVGLSVVARTVIGAGRPPAGPVEPVWDREACAFCAMHVGERGFACQLQSSRGDVRFFDDPGCLLEDLDATKPEIHAIYFHAHDSDRWLSREEVRFVALTPTPMGYGLAAVSADTPGSMSLEQAEERVRARRESRR